MSETERPRYAPEWLALRESADAAARAPQLLDALREHAAGAADGARAKAADGTRASAAGGTRASGSGEGYDLAGPGERSESSGPSEGFGSAGPGEGSDSAGSGAHSASAQWVVRDLGCGTGSMGRWLAPRLPGAQHWILHDHDPALLTLAAAQLPRTAADGSPVTVATETGDVARLDAERLTGTSLVTASALLDLLTYDELDALAAACAGAGCPALLALSVVGRVELTPADPLDAEIAEAFNDHQRRVEHGRRLLGPDAVDAASEVFARHGMTVRVAAAPWRLGPAESALTAEWLRGWVAAACEQRPELAARADRYLQSRLAACAAGELRAAVHHSDVLALPGPTGGAS
ncbi:methyltransferase domain-containing protein [Streptomyces sp. NPDC051907]|uniref:methyltransferase domain-containing protein n=1 Tax=Streptomyces sp. NPDC051907 TaxID=3155284 RepID=UPI00342C21D5